MAPLRREPQSDAPLDTEALMGERLTVYEITDEGWAWAQLENDDYVGYLPASALVPPAPTRSHKVSGVRTLVFPGPSIKLPPLQGLPFGARVELDRDRRRARLHVRPAMCRSAIWCRSRTKAAISSPSPSASSAARICGAARPASASTARDWCRSR